MTSKQIIVRKAKKGEKILTLDEKEYLLDKNVLLIADKKGPLAIAGIKGGKRAEIDGSTKTILIESANFNRLIIRKASRKLGLRTDASNRFEHGLDPNLTLKTLERVAALILEVAGGKIVELGDFYPKPVKPWRIKLPFEKVEKLTGVKIPGRKIIDILERLKLKIVKKHKEYVLVEIPTRRQDLKIAEDLVEEVIRIYGVDKIPVKHPLVYVKAVDRNTEIYWQDKIRDFLKGLKFVEVFTYSFIGQKQKAIYKYSNRSLIELENPISSEYQYLRPSLIPNLLEAAKKNFRHFDRFQIFEIGEIFNPISKGVDEKKSLAFLLADKNKEPAIEDFREFKGIVETFLQELGITDYFFDEVNPLIKERIIFWHPYRLAAIKVGDKTIGALGEIHPFLLQKLETEGTVMLAEFNLESLITIARDEQEFQPISSYPAAVRDISLLVPLEERVEKVLQRITTLGGDLVRDVDLFDIYREENIPKGKQSLAFRIVFQAKNRTLKPDEIDKLLKKIIKGLERNKKWKVRKS